MRIHENDREGLERLFRYAVRPPFALHRLSQGPDGRLVYRMKRSRGGSLFLVLTPDQLLARIATLVPPPRSHALRYHGVFAPNAKHRSRVVPAARRAEPAPASPDPGPPAEPEPPVTTPPVSPAAGSAGAFQLTSPEPPPERPSPRYRVPWAELLRKVFAIDVLECPECAGRLEVVAFIAEATVARRILDHLGMDARAPPLARARANDEEAFDDPGPDHAVGDPAYED